MTHFDPWPYLADPLLSRDDLSEFQRLQILWAADLDSHRPVTGIDVLSAVSRCASNGVPVPEWLAADLASRLSKAKSCQVQSLDDPAAFGPGSMRKGEHVSAAVNRKRWGHVVELMFTPNGAWPRTLAQRKLAAQLTGLTPKQIAAMLKPGRTNKRKPKTVSRAEAGTAADPFGITTRSIPKT